MKKCVQIIGGFLIGLTFFCVTRAYTEEVGFDIQAIKQENQLDKEKTYFDLRMKPSQEQTIEFVLNNSSDDAGRYSVTVAQAFTNDAGFIEYRANDSKLDDSSLTYPIDKLVDYQKEVTVPAKSSLKVPIKIKMPEKQFDGQIWAAIMVNKLFTKKQQEEQKGIANQYGYVLSLHLTETDTPIKRELKLKKVEANIAFNKPAAIAYLQNPTMDAYGSLKYQAKVTNNKTGETIIEKQYDTGMQMAPNSTYPFALEWDKKTMQPGDYMYELTVSDKRGNVWKFNQEFPVTRQNIRKINDLMIGNVEKKGKMWLMIIIGIIVFLLVSIGFLLFLLTRRKKDDEEEQKKSSPTEQ